MPTGLVTFSDPALQQKPSEVSQAVNLVQQTDMGSVETWPRWAERLAVSGRADPRLAFVIKDDPK